PLGCSLDGSWEARQRRVDALLEQEHMEDAGQVSVSARDLPAVDAPSLGIDRSGEIDGSKVVAIEKEAVRGTALIGVGPDDVPLGVDAFRLRTGRFREVEEGVHTTAQKKTARAAAL